MNLELVTILSKIKNNRDLNLLFDNSHDILKNINDSLPELLTEPIHHYSHYTPHWNNDIINKILVGYVRVEFKNLDDTILLQLIVNNIINTPYDRIINFIIQNKLGGGGTIFVNSFKKEFKSNISDYKNGLFVKIKNRGCIFTNYDDTGFIISQFNLKTDYIDGLKKYGFEYDIKNLDDIIYTTKNSFIILLKYNTYGNIPKINYDI